MKSIALGHLEVHCVKNAVLFTIKLPNSAGCTINLEQWGLDFPSYVRERSSLPLCLLFFCQTSKAFAWWSDLMVEHAETFLSLFAVDMDAALEVQPPDTWDSFPLFQLLNDFLRTDCMYHLWLFDFPKRCVDKQIAKTFVSQADYRMHILLHRFIINSKRNKLTANEHSLFSSKCPVAETPSVN